MMLGSPLDHSHSIAAYGTFDFVAQPPRLFPGDMQFQPMMWVDPIQEEERFSYHTAQPHVTGRELLERPPTSQLHYQGVNVNDPQYSMPN